MNNFLNACKSAHNISYIMSSSEITIQENIAVEKIVEFQDYIDFGNITIKKNIELEETTEFEDDIVRSWTYHGNEIELTLLIA